MIYYEGIMIMANSFFSAAPPNDSDFEKIIDDVAWEETHHAPAFDFDHVSGDLKKVIDILELPEGEEREQKLADCSKELWSVPDGESDLLLAESTLNKLRYINRYMRSANNKLKQDGYFVCGFDTALMRKTKIFCKYKKFWANIIYFFDFVWNRVFPKVILTRRFYYLCTKGEKMVLPRPEVLGRLYYCGFEVVAEKYIYDRYYVIAQKKHPPCTEPRRYGMIVKLKRIGKGGKIFNVYKFRTMYAYSDYLQNYVYVNNELDDGGKFKDDYRVTEWGRILRKLWIDELPMIVNILLFQMKPVGVRPLSEQYFSLYSEEMQQLRIKTRPGLLPPFYVDMPVTLEEIQEKRYLEAYFKHPLLTDWKYFWKILYSIVFKKNRSK